jgi:uncharacterized protein DUF6932
LAAVIPAFRGNGYLPPGAHQTAPREVEQRLVEVFPASVTRRALHHDWRARREGIFALVPADMEWVDGSFVSLKLDPADVDVVTFVDGDTLDALSAADKQTFLDLFGSRLRTKLATGCDSFLVIVRPVGHAHRATYDAFAAYWHKWWSRDRAGTEKGYLDVRGDP